MQAERYAVYYTATGALAGFGASWLGWDIATDAAVPQPDVAGIDAITALPSRYGFHATLKPPFRLADDATPEALDAAVGDLAARLAIAMTPGLRLDRIGGFLALVPVGDALGIDFVAGACVRDLDRFRAPTTDAELTRRRAAGLTEAQDAHLVRWGYPYVMEAFRFHMTLTGPLPEARIAAVEADLAGRLVDCLPDPFRMDALSLVGEGADGRFRLIHRYTLAG